MFRAHAVGATAAAAAAESRRRENALVVRVSDKLAESEHLQAQSNAVPCNPVQSRAGPGGAMRCRAVLLRACWRRSCNCATATPVYWRGRAVRSCAVLQSCGRVQQRADRRVRDAAGCNTQHVGCNTCIMLQLSRKMLQHDTPTGRPPHSETLHVCAMLQRLRPGRSDAILRRSNESLSFLVRRRRRQATRETNPDFADFLKQRECSAVLARTRTHARTLARARTHCQGMRALLCGIGERGLQGAVRRGR
jgi:hypothetical protein